MASLASCTTRRDATSSGLRLTAVIGRAGVQVGVTGTKNLQPQSAAGNVLDAWEGLATDHAAAVPTAGTREGRHPLTDERVAACSGRGFSTEGRLNHQIAMRKEPARLPGRWTTRNCSTRTSPIPALRLPRRVRCRLPERTDLAASDAVWEGRRRLSTGSAPACAKRGWYRGRGAGRPSRIR